MPAPVVDDLDDDLAADRMAPATSIAACGSVYLTAFSSSASRAVRNASGSARSDPGDVELEAPRARRDLRPAHEDVFEEAVDGDVAQDDEVRLLGLGEQQ